MAYVYGLLLVVLIARSGGIRGLLRAAVPAAITGIALATAQAAWFGPIPVVNSLLPIRGAASYKTLNYGFFFGRGRDFWWPAGVRPRHYIFTPAGHYLVGTVLLAAAALASAWRLIRRRSGEEDVNAEVVTCCGIMHVVFLTTFYGNFMSYTYYYYILTIAFVALSVRGRGWALAIALLAAAALVGNKDEVNWLRMQWRDTSPSAETFGLWTDAGFLREWREVRRIMGDRPASFLTGSGGCMELYLPQFAPAEDVFLLPGWPLPAELERKARQVANAEVILIRGFANTSLYGYRAWPPLGKALEGFEVTLSGERFLVLERRRPPVAAAPTPADAR
jgi:hypothetical protein